MPHRSAWLLLSFLLALLSTPAQADSQAWLNHGALVVESYTLQDIALSGPLKFARSLPSGMLLAGGNDHAAVFDGSRWNPLPGVARCVSVLQTRSGRLYVGSAGAIHELECTDSGGVIVKHSFQVDQQEVPIDFVTELQDGRIAALFGKGIVIIEKNNSITRHLLGSWVRGLVSINSGIFLTVDREDYVFARYHQDDGAIEILQERYKECLGGRRVVNLLKRDDDSCYIITLDGKVFIFDGTTMSEMAGLKEDGQIHPLPTAILRPPGGGLIYGTSDAGVLFFDDQGSLIDHCDVDRGLPENSIADLSLDQDGGLWITTSRNIVRVDLRRRFLSFGEKQGLPIKECEIILRHRGRLYVAGEEGLFEQNLDAGRAAQSFRKIPDLVTARGLCTDGENLWIGGHQLAAIHPDGKLRYYPTGAAISLLVPSGGPYGLVCGTMNGFAAMKRQDEGWTVAHRIDVPELVCYNITERRQGEYWGACGTGKVARLILTGKEPKITIFTEADGVPHRWVDLLLHQGQLYVGADNDLSCVFDDSAQRFVPATLGYCPKESPLLFAPVFYDEKGQAWIHDSLRNSNEIPSPPLEIGQALQVISRMEAGFGRGFFTDTDGSHWVCHIGGVLRCNEPLDTAPASHSPRLILESVKNLNSPAATDYWNGKDLQFSFNANSLAITAAYLDLRSPRYNHFKIWLAGLEAEPVEWSTQSRREMTHIPHGRYTLKIRGRNGLRSSEEELSIPLVILAPWYLSWPALLLYALAAGSLVYGYGRLRERTLRKRNRLLEQAVAAGRSELERKHHELIQANKALVANTEAKTEFIRKVSHELRNPLAGAALLVEAVKSGDNNGQLLHLKRCIRYMNRLLDETLDLTQIETGHIAMKCELFRLGDMLGEIKALFAPLAGQQGLDFHVTSQDLDDRILFGDHLHCRRILINLLGNAFKFTRQGCIRLQAHASSTEHGILRLRFVVSDTGSGIPEHLKPHLFKKFVRENSAIQADTQEGAGLGLALCRQLAQSMDGEVGYLPHQDQGSSFWTEIPFLQPTTNQENTACEESGVLDYSHRSVAIIDDDTIQLQAQSIAFEAFSVVPDLYAYSPETQALLTNVPHDILILDYYLGTENGINLFLETLAPLLRKSSVSTRVFLVSANLDAELKARALQAGFAGAFAKPLSMLSIYRILTG